MRRVNTLGDVFVEVDKHYKSVKPGTAPGAQKHAQPNAVVALALGMTVPTLQKYMEVRGALHGAAFQSLTKAWAETPQGSRMARPTQLKTADWPLLEEAQQVRLIELYGDPTAWVSVGGPTRSGSLSAWALEVADSLSDKIKKERKEKAGGGAGGQAG